jgi:hypothetical protein
MKTMLQFKFFVAVAFFTVLLTSPAFAQKFDGSKTLAKSVAVPANVILQVKNHSGDLKISTTGSNNVMLNSKIEISGNSQADVDKVTAAIENLKFGLRGNILEIDTRFYKNMNTSNNRSTITLLNGDKVNIKDFKISHELQIPKSAAIELDNKYSDIEMQPVDGPAKFVIYSSKLNAGDFGGDVSIESKYSKIRIGNIKGNAKFDFYDSNLELESSNNLSLKSKYSKYIIKKTGNAEIDSYDDKLNITELSGLSLISKYSDFESTSALKDLKLDLYDSNIKVKSAVNASFNGKYCELHLGDIADLQISESYDNNIYLGNVKRMIVGNSKYSLYELSAVTEITMNDMYDENLKISGLNNDFKGISVNGKYGQLIVNAGSVPFKTDFKIKYPKVSLPENLKISKQIKDDSNLELIAGDAGGIIKINGYDMKVVIEN